MSEEIILSGRYRLDSELGRGAMGVVWRAYDQRLDREIAVKVFPHHVDLDQRRLDRFRAEARLCGRLQHPGIVVVHDADEDNGRLFFVMELLEGTDLAKVMSKSPNGLPIDRVVNIGARLGEALAAAHAKKVIHRDVKPANIMLLPRDRPKICDFGIARVVDAGHATMQVGTPAYAAPEQSDGAPDERSDLYSLGCVLYEMATGDRPFHGNTWSLLFQHATKNPLPPSSVRSDIPSPLEELILQLLAKKPEERPQSAAEVAARLRAMRLPARKSGGSQPHQLPSGRLLKAGTSERKHTDVDDAMAKAIGAVLHQARVDAKVAGYVRTPELTRFEVRLGPTTSEAEILGLAAEFVEATNNSATRLAPMRRSTSFLPDAAAIGVEVPHRAPDLPSLGDILREAPEGGSLLAGLGRSEDGVPVFLNFDETPHVLIGGSGGPFDPLRTITASFAMRHQPKHLRMVIIGRRSPFIQLPHVVDQAQGNPLAWALAEIDCRYADLTSRHCRTTEEFNRGVREGRFPAPIGALGDATMAHPDVVVIIDELAEVDDGEAVRELTREGRAVGFHVIARAAEPVENVLNSRIKAYFPARLALPMNTVEESLNVLDRMGADMLGSGSALLLTGGSSEPDKVRLAAISDEEIAAIVNHWRG
ncbi:DNA translocase FtsK [Nonomuraea bangladeshensis]|uniref:DNA translocase FtsK n=1 Tax=Nonomuraea bangladeshensis TaxID=404385 RepID=UPI0031DE9C11